MPKESVAPPTHVPTATRAGPTRGGPANVRGGPSVLGHRFAMTAPPGRRSVSQTTTPLTPQEWRPMAMQRLGNGVSRRSSLRSAVQRRQRAGRPQIAHGEQYAGRDDHQLNICVVAGGCGQLRSEHVGVRALRTWVSSVPEGTRNAVRPCAATASRKSVSAAAPIQRTGWGKPADVRQDLRQLLADLAPLPCPLRPGGHGPPLGLPPGPAAYALACPFPRHRLQAARTAGPEAGGRVVSPSLLPGHQLR